MELLFIWIQEYFILRNCAFNFSNEYFVSAEISEKNRTIQLDVKRNEKHIPYFFPGKIINVTAVIGENGVGKSTLMDLILNIIHNPDTVAGAWVALLKDSATGVLKVRRRLFDPATKSSFQFDGNIQLQPDDFPSRPFDYDPAEGLKNASIFYNPSLDIKEYAKSVNDPNNGIADVSTNFLIWEDNQEYSEDKHDQVLRHRFKNTFRQFALAQSELVPREHLKIPDSIEVRFNKDRRVDKSDLGFKARDVYEWLDERGSTAAQNANGPIEDTHKDFDLNQRAKLEKVKIWFLRNLVNNYFYNLAITKDLNDKKFKVSISDVEAPEFHTAVERFFSLEDIGFDYTYPIKQFLETVMHSIDEDAILSEDVPDNDAFYSVPVSKALPIHKAHAEYLGVFGRSKTRQDVPDRFDGFLDFNWRDLSNGEKAFVDLYSRLFHGYQQVQDGLLPDSLLMVLIDEGELGFHPQWQKDYLTNILTFLDKLTGGTASDVKVQLIVTSHSPFLVSDLPKGNVILMDKDANGSPSVTDLETKSETFGANIHELYADSFFLRNGTIGSFATKKIEEIIKLIGESDRTDKVIRDKIKATIDVIGEPVIKERLLDLFSEKYGERESAQERVDRLRRELDDAQKQLGNEEG